MLNKIQLKISLLLFTCLFLSLPMSENVQADEFKNLPVKGMVTMIDLGAKKCIPCKMMAPILEKMKKVYKGKAAIVFIDVWENPEQTKRFKIRAIPTQIFFNEKREEVYRHLGFMDEKKIVRQLTKMGVDSTLPEDKSNSSFDRKKDYGKTKDK